MDVIKREPVRFWASVTAVVSAVVALLVGFEVLDWTADQIALVMAVVAAVGGVVQFFYVREQVTPTE